MSAQNICDNVFDIYCKDCVSVDGGPISAIAKKRKYSPLYIISTYHQNKFKWLNKIIQYIICLPQKDTK